MSGDLAKLSGIKILISQYIEDDVMVVSPATFEKMRQWFGDSVKLNKDKLYECHHELIPKEIKESEGA